MLKIKGNILFKPSQQPSQTLANPREVIDIVDLLRWAYQTQRVDEVVRRSVPTGINGAYHSNAARAFETGCLGVLTDGGRSGYGADGADYLPEDAERIHDAVRALPRKMIGIVIDFAKQGDMPDWMEGITPRPVAKKGRRGQPDMEFFDGAKTRPAYCLLRYVPVDPTHIEFARKQYADWWDAVASLVPHLRHLDRFQVTGPSAPRLPWCSPS